MELTRFRDNLYGRMNGRLFLWEPGWDSFRPFDDLAWNGTVFVHITTKYTNDIWNPDYGYGSAEMRELCKRLTDETELETENECKTIEQFWLWCKTPTVWWRDRKCVFSKCAPQDIQSWKRYIVNTASKPKTLRHRFHSRTTRRLRLR
jgi:hypothetical protein